MKRRRAVPPRSRAPRPANDLDAAIAGDAASVRRIARDTTRVAPRLAEIVLRGRTPEVINLAAAALARRRTDPAAIVALARVLCEAPSTERYQVALDWAAEALAARTEPRATNAAIACYRALPAGRARYFLIQTLSNRTERDGVLRSHTGLADLLLEVAASDAEERGEAIWALWKIADPRTTHALIDLLESDDAYVGKMAALALARIGTESARAAVEGFIARCTDEDTVEDVRAELKKRRR